MDLKSIFGGKAVLVFFICWIATTVVLCAAVIAVAAQLASVSDENKTLKDDGKFLQNAVREMQKQLETIDPDKIENIANMILIVEESLAGLNSFNDTLEDIQERQSSLRSDMDDLEQENVALWDKAAGLESDIISRATTSDLATERSRIDGLANDLSDTTADVTDLQTEETTIKTRLDDVESLLLTKATAVSVIAERVRITSLTNTVNDADEGIAALNAKVDTLEGDIVDLEAEDTSIWSSLNDAGTGLPSKATNTALNAAKDRITALENIVDDPNDGLQAQH